MLTKTFWQTRQPHREVVRLSRTEHASWVRRSAAPLSRPQHMAKHLKYALVSRYAQSRTQSRQVVRSATFKSGRNQQYAIPSPLLAALLLKQLLLCVRFPVFGTLSEVPRYTGLSTQLVLIHPGLMLAHSRNIPFSL